MSLQLFRQLPKQQPRVVLDRLQLKNYPEVSPEELKTILEKDRKISAAHRQLLQRSNPANVKPTNGHRQTSNPENVGPTNGHRQASTVVESRAVTFDLSPSSDLTDDDDGRQEMVDVKSDQKLFDGNSFYHHIMYSNTVVGKSPTKVLSNSPSDNPSNNPSTIEYIELSSSEDEDEIDDPEEDYEIISDFEDDENLADAVRNVPEAASAAIRMKLATSDPLRIV